MEVLVKSRYVAIVDEEFIPPELIDHRSFRTGYYCGEG
jgi:hypothetical protein